MAINLTLKPKSELLNCNFEGYKLKSADDQVLHTKNIEDGIFKNDKEDVTCYLYTKMESLHNHLFSDPFDENCVYYYNKKGHLTIITLADNYLSQPKVVWQEDFETQKSKKESGKKYWFSPTLSFPSPNLALSSNGRGLLTILLTGDRNGSDTWVNSKSEVVPPGELVHSLLVENSKDSEYIQELHLLLLSITSFPDLQKDPLHCNLGQFDAQKSSLHIIYWFTFGFNGSEWCKVRERRIVGSNALDYVCLDASGHSVMLLCHSHYAFVYDSETHVKEITSKSTSKVSKNMPKKYVFMQHDDEIKIWVNAGKDVSKDQLKIDVENLAVKIWVEEKLLLDKRFLNAVDSKASTWSIEKDKIEICLPKSKEGERWARLFEEEQVEGEEILDEQYLEEVHQRLLHLTSEEWNPRPELDKPSFNPGQLEECDDASEDLSLLVLNGVTHLASHTAHLGSVQHLFNVVTKGSLVPSFCLRHDVDGLVWETKEGSQFDHVTTFDAFGYVKASKTMAKFTGASPDTSYAAIADVTSHVYVFCQSDNFGGELKNRTSGKRTSTVARQLVISLKDHDQVMGLHLASKSIFVLTENHLFVYDL